MQTENTVKIRWPVCTSLASQRIKCKNWGKSGSSTKVGEKKDKVLFLLNVW